MEHVSDEIIINQDSAIRDIQTSFNRFYPFLKIEFHHDHHDTGLSFKNKKIDAAYNIKQVSRQRAPIRMDIRRHRTVAEIEHDFKEMLGLYARFFRKSGAVWNVISYTNNWTLESQNKAGEFICKEMQQHRI